VPDTPVLIISQNKYYVTNRLAQEARKANFSVEICDVKELAAKNFSVEPAKYSSLYIRQAFPHYEALLKLALAFKAAGKLVVDDITTDNFDTSKWSMYQRLQRAGIVVPETRLYDGTTLGEAPVFPCIAKWIHGSLARDRGQRGGFRRVCDTCDERVESIRCY
jgi:glutathione synthase/RimK-type ligase-like ATP-grasp enzyme